MFSNINVLIACEESQTECLAFRNAGFNAFSCDIQECSGGHPEWHIQGDVLPLLSPKWYDLNRTGEGEQWEDIKFQTMDGRHHQFEGRWDLIVAHPPCTFMTKCGARWMFPKSGQVDPERYAKAMEAKEFLFKIASADCEFIAIENPVPLKIVGLPPPSQKTQPYEFGDPYSKQTCWWLKNLPKLTPTNILTEYVPWICSNTGEFSRGKGGSRGVARGQREASKSFPGISAAMPEQWGKYVWYQKYGGKS